MKKQPDKLINSWEISVLEDYLGNYAQYFSYDGTKATCSVKCIDDDDCDFNLELIYSAAAKSVTFYIQPLNDLEEDTSQYPQIKCVGVPDPNSNETMHETVKNVFTAFDVVNRLKDGDDA